MFSYFRATEDVEFMIKYGAEMLIENLRFWASFLKYNKEIDRYETINIMGPDEYHANLNNNYYTNYLLGFIIRQSLAFLNVLRTKKAAAYKNIIKKLKVAPAELTKWNDLNGKIYLPPAKDGVLEQFSGYFNLRDYKIDRYNEFGIPIINELEYLKDPSHPKYTPTLTHYHEALVKFARSATLIKQADTILLFNLFPHEFSEDTKRKTLAYYEPRTLHYSSLSPGVYALAAARLGEQKLAAEALASFADYGFGRRKARIRKGLAYADFRRGLFHPYRRLSQGYPPMATHWNLTRIYLKAGNPSASNLYGRAVRLISPAAIKR